MRRARIATLALVTRGCVGSMSLIGTMLGCGGSSSSDYPTIPEEQAPLAPALESVPFQLLGTGKIAFQRIRGDGEVGATYVVDATAASSTPALANEDVMGPALSPDGRRFAYAGFTDIATGLDVYVANIDGTGAQQVTRFTDQDGAPTWTPDGARIVMAAGSGTPAWNVYSQSAVANPGDQTQLTQFTLAPGTAVTCPILVYGDQGRISISSGGRLAFACGYGEIDVSTNGTFSAAYVPLRNDRRRWPNVFAPSWSPDGARIAFIEITSDSAANYTMLGFAVKVMNADGSNVTTLASIPTAAGSNVTAGGGYVGYNNLSLCWMPDGSRVVFNVPESQTVGHLWVARADGSGLAQLTTSPNVWDRSVSCSR